MRTIIAAIWNVMMSVLFCLVDTGGFYYYFRLRASNSFLVPRFPIMRPSRIRLRQPRLLATDVGTVRLVAIDTTTRIKATNPCCQRHSICHNYQTKSFASTSEFSEQEKHDNAGNQRIIQRPFFFLYYVDLYKVPLPSNHSFPMEKHGKVRQRVQTYILNDMTIQNQQQQQCENNDDCTDHVIIKSSNRHRHDGNGVDCVLNESPIATIPELVTTHCPKYIQRFLTGQMTTKEMQRIGIPWSIEYVNRVFGTVGGTVQAAVDVCNELLLRQKQQQEQEQSMESRNTAVGPCWGAHIAGGSHHSFYDYGEGYCVFNDIAVACNVLLQKYPMLIQNIVIIDLDVHQGNGNAVLFHNNPNVFTFSIHCTANYFSTKQQSNLDIELPESCTDETYLLTLKYWLNRFRTNTTGMFGSNDDDAKTTTKKIDIIFFQAGVDVLKNDRIGRFHLSSKGVQKRNDLVYQFAYELNVPLIITMGGGYPKLPRRSSSSSSSANNTNETEVDAAAAWEPILDAHTNVYVQAYEFLKLKTHCHDYKR